MGLLDRLIAGTVEKYILAMIRNGTWDEDFPNLVYDAARSYAKANGGSCYSDTPDICSLNKEFGGKYYYITFIRGRRATNVTLAEQPSASSVLEEDANRVVREVKACPVLEAVLESYKNKPRVVRSRRVDQQAIESFFEVYATSLPNRFSADEAASVYLGLGAVPGVGVLVVMAAILRGEAIISAPGCIEAALSPENREALLAWQNEAFEDYRAFIEAEARKDPEAVT